MPEFKDGPVFVGKGKFVPDSYQPNTQVEAHLVEVAGGIKRERSLHRFLMGNSLVAGEKIPQLRSVTKQAGIDVDLLDARDEGSRQTIFLNRDRGTTLALQMDTVDGKISTLGIYSAIKKSGKTEFEPDGQQGIRIDFTKEKGTKVVVVGPHGEYQLKTSLRDREGKRIKTVGANPIDDEIVDMLATEYQVDLRPFLEKNVQQSQGKPEWATRIARLVGSLQRSERDQKIAAEMPIFVSELVLPSTESPNSERMQFFRAVFEDVPNHTRYHGQTTEIENHILLEMFRKHQGTIHRVEKNGKVYFEIQSHKESLPVVFDPVMQTFAKYDNGYKRVYDKGGQLQSEAAFRITDAGQLQEFMETKPNRREQKQRITSDELFSTDQSRVAVGKWKSPMLGGIQSIEGLTQDAEGKYFKLFDPPRQGIVGIILTPPNPHRYNREDLVGSTDITEQRTTKLLLEDGRTLTYTEYEIQDQPGRLIDWHRADLVLTERQTNGTKTDYLLAYSAPDWDFGHIYGVPPEVGDNTNLLNPKKIIPQLLENQPFFDGNNINDLLPRLLLDPVKRQHMQRLAYGVRLDYDEETRRGLVSPNYKDTHYATLMAQVIEQVPNDTLRQWELAGVNKDHEFMIENASTGMTMRIHSVGVEDDITIYDSHGGTTYIRIYNDGKHRSLTRNDAYAVDSKDSESAEKIITYIRNAFMGEVPPAVKSAA